MIDKMTKDPAQRQGTGGLLLSKDRSRKAANRMIGR